MVLVCDKFGEEMESDGAQCTHPNDYCQYRKKCLIHFIGQESKREKREQDSHQLK